MHHYRESLNLLPLLELSLEVRRDIKFKMGGGGAEINTLFETMTYTF